MTVSRSLRQVVSGKGYGQSLLFDFQGHLEQFEMSINFFEMFCLHCTEMVNKNFAFNLSVFVDLIMDFLEHLQNQLIASVIA